MILIPNDFIEIQGNELGCRVWAQKPMFKTCLDFNFLPLFLCFINIGKVDEQIEQVGSQVPNTYESRQVVRYLSIEVAIEVIYLFYFTHFDSHKKFCSCKLFVFSFSLSLYPSLHSLSISIYLSPLLILSFSLSLSLFVRFLLIFHFL